ncbi:type III-B CRISPR module-associated protein Cmr5 [Candidatus Leptofilum sp.]|uniref:type III-B CRISPR module-associated protein Cmr5 n=1 Tax=Candidatus Leptofilum sp. TaxID=3241576 RepID=UPI003B5A2714
MQTIQQQLAKQAHTHIQTITQTDRQKYATMAHKLPILIRSAGLIQALGFVQARGSHPQTLLLDHVALAIQVGGITDGDSLVNESRNAPLEQYIFLTKRVMMALLWYKRFVESEFGISARDAANDVETAVSAPAT